MSEGTRNLPRTGLMSPTLAPHLTHRSSLHGAPCVLLVDDEAAIRSALSRFFARRGWHVCEAGDGDSARHLLELSSGNAFDLVICDLRMPRFSGSELYQWLLLHRPEAITRFVFASGDVLSQASTDFLAATRRPVLPKPFELEELGRIADEISRAAHAA